MGGLFCGCVLTGTGVEKLSKQSFEGLACCSVIEADNVNVRGAGGDEGAFICSVFVMHSCCCCCCCSCCCWQTIAAVAVSLVFSGLGATGMWCWQGVLSAVWRMTLVAMALQGCGRGGREGVFSAMGARTG